MPRRVSVPRTGRQRTAPDARARMPWECLTPAAVILVPAPPLLALRFGSSDTGLHLRLGSADLSRHLDSEFPELVDQIILGHRLTELPLNQSDSRFLACAPFP